jgi:hypothetical protein
MLKTLNNINKKNVTLKCVNVNSIFLINKYTPTSFIIKLYIYTFNYYPIMQIFIHILNQFYSNIFHINYKYFPLSFKILYIIKLNEY